MENPEKRRPGRPRRYEKLQSGSGAPVLRVRLEPDCFNFATNHPEGTRQYLERLIREDREKSGLDELDLAPYDDEEPSPEEEEDARIGREELARGERGESLESIAARLGL